MLNGRISKQQPGDYLTCIQCSKYKQTIKIDAKFWNKDSNQYVFYLEIDQKCHFHAMELVKTF